MKTENPICTPNLPEAKVRLAAVAENAYEVIAALRREGTEVFPMGREEALPMPVQYHSDLQLLHIGGKVILAVKESKDLIKQLTKIGFTVATVNTKLGKEYPQDVSLNFLLLKNCCFGLSSNIPLQLSEYCNHAGLQVIHAKQGYARCSVAVVGPEAAITADTALCELLTAAGIDTLLVGGGDIVLEGYDTGFLGGCCGLIAPNRLAFTGSLERYRYGAQALAFLQKHGVTPVYLTQGKLLDIGGILPLTEDG